MGEKGRGVGGKEGMNHKGRESGNGRGGGQNTYTKNPLFFISAAVGSHKILNYSQ